MGPPTPVFRPAWSVAGRLLLEVGQRVDRRLDYRGGRALRATQQPLAEQRLRLAGATLLPEIPGVAHGGAEAVHWVATLVGQCHCALPLALRLSQESSSVSGSCLGAGRGPVEQDLSPHAMERRIPPWLVSCLRRFERHVHKEGGRGSVAGRSHPLRHPGHHVGAPSAIARSRGPGGEVEQLGQL